MIVSVFYVVDILAFGVQYVAYDGWHVGFRLVVFILKSA